MEFFYLSHLDDLQMFEWNWKSKDQSAEIPISKRESPSFCKHQLIMSIMKINKLSNALINYQNNTKILTTTSSRKYIYFINLISSVYLCSSQSGI